MTGPALTRAVTAGRRRAVQSDRRPDRVENPRCLPQADSCRASADSVPGETDLVLSGPVTVSPKTDTVSLETGPVSSVPSGEC